MSLWDDVKLNMADWYSIATDKTGEIMKVGVRKYDRFGISRDVERQFAELGGFVYNALNEGREDFLDDQTLIAIMERIKGLEAELTRKEEEISSIRSEYQTRAETKKNTAEPDVTDQEDVEDDAVPVVDAEPVTPPAGDVELEVQVVLESGEVEPSEDETKKSEE